MAVFYGVLRGTVDRWKREDLPAGSNKSPHLQIRVLDGHGNPWRIPVNVRSSDQEKSLVIFHKVDPLLSHPILSGLPTLPTGLTDLNNQHRTVANSLDYLRAPLFDWPNGIALPPTGPNDQDDVQDVVSHYLADLKQAQGELFAFGSHWHDPSPKPGIDVEFGTVNGMHDIHMNQGNAPHAHDEDNGVMNDGGLILSFAGRFVGLFFRFKTQWLPTDANGDRLPNSREIPPGASPTDGGGDDGTSDDHGNSAFPEVYIERALVNPVGEDPGKEVIVIGNTTTSSVDLSGWSIVDKNNIPEVLSGVLLPSGGSVSIVLSGNAAQLSNKGGTIRLLNNRGTLIHAVSYSKSDIVESRFLRFNT